MVLNLGEDRRGGVGLGLRDGLDVDLGEVRRGEGRREEGGEDGGGLHGEGCAAPKSGVVEFELRPIQSSYKMSPKTPNCNAAFRNIPRFWRQRRSRRSSLELAACAADRERSVYLRLNNSEHTAPYTKRGLVRLPVGTPAWAKPLILDFCEPRAASAKTADRPLHSHLSHLPTLTPPLEAPN